jgi:hypothetical protein
MMPRAVIARSAQRDEASPIRQLMPVWIEIASLRSQ